MRAQQRAQARPRRLLAPIEQTANGDADRRLIPRSCDPPAVPGSGLARDQSVDLGLFFGVTSERVGAEIDFLSLVANPKHMVTVLFDPNFLKILRLLQPSEDAFAGDDWPEVDNPFISIIEYELQHAVNDSLGGNDARQFLFHSIIRVGKCACVRSQNCIISPRRGVAHVTTALSLPLGRYPLMSFRD